jgi:hypothetical protein
MNLPAVAGLLTRPERGVWYRAVPLRFLASALATAHTATVRSRFNAGPLLAAHDRFEIAYLAGTHFVALSECGATFGVPWGAGGLVSNPHLAVVILNVTVQLQTVCDLTDWSSGGSQDLLKTNAQELTGDWDGWHARGVLVSAPVAGPTGPAPTQDLGLALKKQGVEGFLAISAKVPTERNLVVLPQNLGPASFVEFRDPTGSLLHRIP